MKATHVLRWVLALSAVGQAMAAYPSVWNIYGKRVSQELIEGAVIDTPWTWRLRGPGVYEAFISIDPDIAPDDNGVVFFVLPINGPLYRDRTDKNPDYHASARSWLEGDRVQAEWTDLSGVGWTAVGEVAS